MKIIDITGPIFEGLQHYNGDVKSFELKKIKMKYTNDKEYDVYSMEGMLNITGTYFETAGDILGYQISDIPIEKLFMIDTYVLNMPLEGLKIVDERPCVFLEDIKKAEKGNIPEKSGIILSTGYGKNWEKKDYLAKSWFLKKESMDYLLDKKPFLIAFDTPYAENDVNFEDVFNRFFKNDVYSLVACINVEKIKKYNVKLVIMPIRLLKVGLGCPARAIVLEE